MTNTGRPKAIPQLLPSPIRPGSDKLEKVIIGSLDDEGIGVEAQYNPKELSIDISVPWTAHKVINAHKPDLEFVGGEMRTISLELLFDGYETGQSVQQSVGLLGTLATVRAIDSTDPKMRRPHFVAVVWGDRPDTIPVFRGVIESISTKYTMFLRDGRPVRATCAVKIKEARKVDRD